MGLIRLARLAVFVLVPLYFLVMTRTFQLHRQTASLVEIPSLPGAFEGNATTIWGLNKHGEVGGRAAASKKEQHKISRLYKPAGEASMPQTGTDFTSNSGNLLPIPNKKLPTL